MFTVVSLWRLCRAQWNTSPWTGGLKDSSYQALFEMLCEMEQDCCAMLNYRTGKGELVGLYAEQWGTFNRDYFVM